MGYGNYMDPFAALRPDYTVGAGEKLELTFVVLPGESRDIDVAIDLVGEGAEVSLKGLYLCGGDERVNFRIMMHHRAGGCVSRQLFDGIAGGTSRVTFDGRIIVAPDAQQTEAYQENHNIVLTTGRLDEDALFYMRTRGVPEAEAKVLQMISFLSPVTESLSEAERERTNQKIITLL